MNDGSSPKNAFFNRQVQSFQFKIQQKLILYDEEIGRLADRLNMTKSQIHAEKERIQQLDREISSANEYKDGESRRRSATFNTIISRAKANYHAQLQSIQSQHMQEITDLQNDFERQLQRFPKKNDSQQISSMRQVEEQIESYKEKIDAYKTQTIKIQQENMKFESELGSPDEAVEGENLAIDFSPIEKLQDAITQRQMERFENLNQSKQKLSQCIELLESMTKEHMINVSEKQQQIREIEEDYNLNLQRIEEKHKTNVELLKIQLIEAEKRTRTLMKAAKHLGSNNHKQMMEAIHELNVKKQKTFEITDNEVLEADEKKQRESLKKEISKLKRQLKHKENDLLDLQQDNQDIKREIWRLKHELKFSNSPTKLSDFD